MSRMSVSRCCCKQQQQPYCPTGELPDHDIAPGYTDDFSTTDPGWTGGGVQPMGGQWSFTGSRLKCFGDPPSGTDNPSIERKFNWDPVLNPVLTQQVTVYTSNAVNNDAIWIAIWPRGIGFGNFPVWYVEGKVGANWKLFYGRVPFTNHRSIDLGVSVADGDVVKIIATPIVPFTVNHDTDLEVIINDVSKVTQRHTDRDIHPYCSARHGLYSGGFSTSTYVEFDDYSLLW